MREVFFNLRVEIFDFKELDNDSKKLIETAKNATFNAYAPYSKFRVGAAVALSNGKIITGTNQENAAYPSGLCAERVALFYANSQFPDCTVTAIAVAAQTENCFTTAPITPCGGCRQVLVETEKKQVHDIKVLLYGQTEVKIIGSVRELLPLTFDEQFLIKNNKV
jgi:cytidine deaminase